MKVLITGGSRGIGKACVERFTAEGHAVVFFYRSNAEAAARVSAETGALAIRADVRNSDEVAEGIRLAVETMGGIDVLICNAGISQIKLFTDLTDADWQTVMDTNLSGAFYAARAVAKHMIARHSGRIITVGSMWGKVGASCEIHYSASKAGLRGLTMALAKELGPSGITVNCIEPGVIATEMNGALDEETIAALCEETPLCRLGSPKEVAALAAFLASEEAGFITGQCIGIDGGFAV